MAEIDYPSKPNTITTTPLKLFGFNIQNSDSSKSPSGSTLVMINRRNGKAMCGTRESLEEER
jgi:hypothetical protein